MNSELSVLIICEEYPPFVRGGLGIHYYELVEELRKICQVKIICSRPNLKIRSFERRGNLEIYRIYSTDIFPLNHVIFNISSFFKTLKIRKDITHLCSPFGLLNIFIKKTPIVSKIHTLYTAQKGNFLYNKVFFPIGSFIDKRMIEKSDKVLTTSNFMKRSIISIYKEDENKVVAINNGVSNFFFEKGLSKSKLRMKLNLPDNKKIILYVGRFVPRKGALNLIKSIPEIVATNKEAFFLFIGGGFSEGSEYEKEIGREIDILGLKEKIRIIPWVEREKLKEYYLASDLFVHPAEYEPFGNNILEAMATGLPIIVSRAGGPEEIFKDNGFLLKNNMPGLISNSVINLLNDINLYDRCSKNSVKRAKYFSWKENARKTLEVYREVINQHAAKNKSS